MPPNSPIMAYWVAEFLGSPVRGGEGAIGVYGCMCVWVHGCMCVCVYVCVCVWV